MQSTLINAIQFKRFLCCAQASNESKNLFTYMHRFETLIDTHRFLMLTVSANAIFQLITSKMLVN